MKNDEERDRDNKAVLAAVEAGYATAGDIEAETKLAMRVVDRTLQRLRKTGKIKLTGAPRRWKAVG